MEKEQIQKQKPRDWRFIMDLKDYKGLSDEEFDVALNGVPFMGERYPLTYVFWQEDRWQRVRTNFNWRDNPEKEGIEVGVDLGLELERGKLPDRIIVLMDEGYVTSLAPEMLTVIE